MSNDRGESVEQAPVAGSRADMSAYADLSKGWEVDRAVAADRSQRRAWMVAGAAVVVAVAAVGAVAGLTPLKEVQPFVVRVDKSNGSVDAVSRLNEASRTESEAVNKYMVGKYVRAREEYSRELAPVNYKAVALMSQQQVAQAYHEWFKPDNPESPMKVYGAAANVGVRILNISFLAGNIASVRYEKTIRGNEGTSRSLWVATVTFRYSNAPMTEDDRLVNPIGFEVTDYRNDPEVGG